jgi:ferredoxin
VIDTLYGEKTCARRDALLEKCLVCPYPAGREHKVYDELIAAEDEWNWETTDRFAEVERLERMTPDERFAFWRAALSRCIRCNACRNACPVCSCSQCVFDNALSGVAAKVNADSFEENMFHIIRAFHVAGRCTDCGECSRVCPQGIPLHLLNRKFIRDINMLYGDYQAGLDGEHTSPLTEYAAQDADPGFAAKGGARR